MAETQRLCGCTSEQECAWPRHYNHRTCVMQWRGALGKAADQFDFYAAQHAAKGTPEAEAKARTNREMAAMCRAAMGSNA